jgi:hypothetical protein
MVEKIGKMLDNETLPIPERSWIAAIRGTGRFIIIHFNFNTKLINEMEKRTTNRIL